MSAFDKHHDEIEKHETMMGQSRGGWRWHSTC